MPETNWFDSLLETISSFAVTLPAAIGFGFVALFIIVPLALGIWALTKRFFDENQRP